MLLQQVAELAADEGLRLASYDDATGEKLRPGYTLRGHPTIAYGRALDVHGISAGEAALLLGDDLTECHNALSSTYPWFVALDPVRQGVLLNLHFNLGSAGLATFEHMLAAIARGDFTTAAAELLASHWASEVQASRSARLIAQLRSGTLTTGGENVSDLQSYPNTVVAGSLNLNVTITLAPALQTLLSGLMGSIQAIKAQVTAMSDSISNELQQLTTSVQNAQTVEQSAVTLIQGIPALIQAAVQQAQANGATPEQLAAFNQLAQQLNTNSQELASAVAAQSGGGNQPTPTPTPSPTPSGP